MISVDKAELRRKARTLSREDMKCWVEREAGKEVSWKQFERLMRENLPLEKDYQKEVIRYLRSVPGAFVWKAAAGPYARSGIPDICCVIDGHFFGFEIKRPIIGAATDIQTATIRNIKAAGGTAAIISTREQAKEEIEAWMEKEARGS